MARLLPNGQMDTAYKKRQSVQSNRKSVAAREAAKQIRESAFSNRKTLTQQVLENQQHQMRDMYDWAHNPSNTVEKVASPLGRLAEFMFTPQSTRDLGMNAKKDPLVGLMDPRERSALNHNVTSNMGVNMIGSASSKAGSKVFGEAIEGVKGKAAPAISEAIERGLQPLMEEGMVTRELFDALAHPGKLRPEQVLQAAEEAGIADLPIFKSLADAPKRGAAVIMGKEPFVREKEGPISLVGKLLGGQFPGSASVKGGYDPKIVASNTRAALRTGHRLFGDFVDEMNPMRTDFYPMMRRGFVEPAARVTGLSEDLISQIGSSLSPRKEVAMEVMQAAELAKRLAKHGPSVGVERLIAGMNEMGLGQLLPTQTANLLKVIDNPTHLSLNPRNVKKIGMYGLNKADDEIAEIEGVPAFTFDTWMRRAKGFSDEALAAPGRQYNDVVSAIAGPEGLMHPEALGIMEDLLRRMGRTAAQAKKEARIPNRGQAVIWSDARNQIGDVIERLVF